MSTDLHAALREAVADAPTYESDLRTVVEAGSRRVRRRAAFRVGSAALVVVAAALASVALGSDRSDPEPRPADVVRLDLGLAESQHLDALASVRTTWRDPRNALDHDRFEGLTTDGLVLRSRYTYEGDVYELGLLNPETGSTDWLPPPPVAAESVVELTADRLVLFTRMSPRRGALLMFDRRAETWETSTVRPPAGAEVHVPFRLALAPDGRLYLGSTFEGVAGPLSWWSYALPEGGEGRPQPDLAGAAVAWGEGVQVSADNEGRVVMWSSMGERVVAEELPAGCESPDDPDLTDMPVTVALAGDRPVVTYSCGDAAQALTHVYDVDGGDAVQVAGAVVRAADEDSVMLSAAQGEHGGIYLLDLDRLSLVRIGSATHDAQVGVADGLVLWNQPGPLDDTDVYDVVWQVAPVPVGD